MDAIILVGGQGTRLRPLTARRHKSLVPVANRPALAHLLAWLSRSSVERAILAIGLHNDDLAEAYPPGRHEGVEVVHVLERQRLESGGAIRNAVAEARVEGRFAVLNGDVYVDFDLAALIATHDASRAELTLALTPVEDPSAFGVAAVGAEGMVTGFVEKPPRGSEPGNLVNAGVWIFEPGLVDEIPPGAVRVEETLFPALVESGRRVLGYAFEGPWADIGTPQRYLDLNVELARAAGGRIIAEDSEAAGATVTASVVGAGSRVAAGATVVRSVLWENVVIGEGAVVEDSVLADGVTVGRKARLACVVAGANAYIADGVTPARGSVLDADAGYHREHDH